MTDYYLDASALVKRYTDEAGSAWTRWLTEPQTGTSVLVAEITLAEVAAALAVKHRAPGGITRRQRDRADFLWDCRDLFLLVPVDRPVIDRAVALTQGHRLRGYDIVQLEAVYGTDWEPIIRYDTAHGIAHRDRLCPPGPKQTLPFPDYNQALTWAIQDIKTRWLHYAERCTAWRARRG